jgi:hypothetical protein
MSKPGDYLIDAVRKHAEGEISKRRANVETYRLNPAGIGEHSDMIDTIEKELDVIARFDDILDVLNKYFNDSDPKKLTLHE